MLSRRHALGALGATLALTIGYPAATILASTPITWTPVTWEGREYMQATLAGHSYWIACRVEDFPDQRDAMEHMLRDPL